MSNPAATGSPAVIRLPGFGFVKATGPDAGAFLQSQLSSDLKQLVDGGAQWSALLNPQGRAIVCFALFRLDPAGFRLLLPEHAIEPTLAHLRRFQLRAKLSLGPDPSIPAGGWLAAGPAPAGSLQTATRWFGAVTEPPVAANPETVARWALADIDEGLIWLSVDQREQFVAQMLGLEQLGAVSLRKGCYPGQEIVARAHYRGAVKRRVIRLRSLAAISPGDRVERPEGGGECGVVLSSAPADGEWRALAVVVTEPASSDYVILSERSGPVRAERCQS
jgi:hypothetical protein